MAAVTRHRRGSGCPALESIYVDRPDETIDLEYEEEEGFLDIDSEGEEAPVIDIFQILKENSFMEIDIETDGDLDEW